MKKYVIEVETRLKAVKPVKKPSIWKAESYVGGGRSKLSFLDIKLPDIRNEFKQGFSFYDPKNKKFDLKTLEAFDYIWKNSNSHDALLICLFYVKTLPFSVRKEHRALLTTWLDKVDNWALSDELSGLYSEYLEDDPSWLSLYKKWNRSENSWKRRQSLVGLLFYSRFRKKKHLTWKQIKDFIDPLLGDSDYYVQKGVGWTLREAYQWYPETVFDYIYKNSGKIDPVGWYACTEKMSAKEKAALKVRRRDRVRGMRAKK